MISLLAVTLGAVIALAANLLAESIRTRRERTNALNQLRYDSYLTFIQAIVSANDALHAISTDDEDRRADVPAAMRNSGLYLARERLIATGSPDMVLAGETAFRAMLELRDAVTAGAPLSWPDYQPSSDGMAEVVWSLRQATRRAFDGIALDLNQITAIQTPGIGTRLLQTEPPP